MNDLAGIAAHLDGADVKAALDLALSTVKAQPSNVDARRLLIDLLILAEDYERADRQADILLKTSPDLTLGMSLLRGRLRAAAARAAWFRDGAVPAFPEGPTERDQAAMELAVAGRAGDEQSLRAALESVTSASETTGIEVNGKSVDSFRDADDRIPHALEILCTDGSYMWVDFGLVEHVAFEPVRTFRDLVWRPTKLTLKDGAESEVITCATYFTASPSDEELLARTTDWTEEGGGLVTGRGQKAFLAGDEAVYAVDLLSLSSR